MDKNIEDTKEMIKRLEGAFMDGVPADEVMKVVLENQLALMENDYWLVTTGTDVRSTGSRIYVTQPINKKPIEFIHECNKKYGEQETYWLVFAMPITKELYQKYKNHMG